MRTVECQEVLESLYSYIDGELPAEELQVLKAHLDDCVDCFGHLKVESAFIQLINERCKEGAVSQVLLERITQRLRNEAS